MSRAGVTRCLLAAVLFGASAPAASRLAGSIPAFTLAGLLYVGAAAAVVPAVLARRPSREAVVAEWRPALIAVVVGGAVGLVFLVAGLARTSAASASILLNTELVATVIFAAVLFREHLGSRLLVSAGFITMAGALLTWEPGAAVDIGAVFITTTKAASPVVIPTTTAMTPTSTLMRMFRTFTIATTTRDHCGYVVGVAR